MVGRGKSVRTTGPLCGAVRRLLHRQDDDQRRATATTGTDEPEMHRAATRPRRAHAVPISVPSDKADAPGAVAGVHHPPPRHRLDAVGLDIDRDRRKAVPDADEQRADEEAQRVPGERRPSRRRPPSAEWRSAARAACRTARSPAVRAGRSGPRRPSRPSARGRAGRRSSPICSWTSAMRANQPAKLSD